MIRDALVAAGSSLRKHFGREKLLDGMFSSLGGVFSPTELTPPAWALRSTDLANAMRFLKLEAGVAV
jgi:hypothetical protein